MTGDFSRGGERSLRIAFGEAEPFQRPDQVRAPAGVEPRQRQGRPASVKTVPGNHAAAGANSASFAGRALVVTTVKL